jgi:hypothetical protein
MLQLAIAETCSPDGCQVKLLSDGRSLEAVYLDRMKGRVFVHPGQLVALDMTSAPPLIVWRWHRMKVLEVQPGGAKVDDRGINQLNGTVAPGISLNLKPGQSVFVIGGQDGSCEIHGLLVGDQLAQREQFEQVILPHIQAIVDKMRAGE